MESSRQESRATRSTTLVASEESAKRARGWASAAIRPAARAFFAGVLVGGVVVAPALVVVALIVLFAPTPLGVRHLVPALIFASLAWLALAIFGAHAQIERESAASADLEVESLPD